MEQQRSLFITQELEYPSNIDDRLLSVIESFDKDRLVLPPFQRGFVWEEPKVKGWADSIIKKNAIGVIVTYQLRSDNGDHPVYLADGRQRLGAAQEILKTPENYGIAGFDQAARYMHEFKITVQHRHYDTHADALEAFQNLNKGTHVTPADYFKGAITNLPDGEEMYSKIVDCANALGASITRNQSMSYEMESKYRRGALALFYQYISKHRQARLWRFASAKIRHTPPPIEMLFAEFLCDRSIREIQKDLQNFNRFAEGQVALISETLREIRGPGNALSTSLFRALLHLAIWRKNTATPVESYRQFLCVVFTNSKGLNASVYYPDDYDSVNRHENLAMDDFSKAFRIAKAYGLSDISSDRNKRKKSQTTARGYDSSHKFPFSTHGEGETFAEPSPLNRARGAKPINDNDNNPADPDPIPEPSI